MRGGLVSVVIPAYNVAEYVGECLASLRRQTYENLEILVVDDGSTDATGAILDEASARDARMRVFHNENHGVSYSRNFAIDRGSGEYLAFVDADDVVAPDFVEALVRQLQDGSCQCSVVGIASFAKGKPSYTHGRRRTFAGKGVYGACLGDCKGFLWNKAFLYRIVRTYGVRLSNDVLQSEDMLFLLDYFDHCDSISFDDGVRYGYRQRRGSAANSHLSTKWFDVLKVFESYEARLGSDSELSEIVHRAFLPIAYEGLWRYRRLGSGDPELLERIQNMRMTCERGIAARPFGYRAKMLVYRHFMGAVMARHQLLETR